MKLDDVHLVIDHNKIKRDYMKLVSKLKYKLDREIKENGFSFLFFVERRDDTKTFMQIWDSDKLYPAIVKEKHYACDNEPDGNYLRNFIPEKGAVKNWS